MKTSQAFISAAAALAVVGAVGFAFAQTTTDKPISTTTPDPMPSQAVTPDSTLPATPGTSGNPIGTTNSNAATGAPGAMSNDASAMPKSGTSAATPNGTDTTGTTGTMPTERAARADRN